MSLKHPRKAPQQHLIFGNVEDLHMSQNSLYLPSAFYLSSPLDCVGCRWPRYSIGQHTLVHKMQLGSGLHYQGSRLLPGLPLSQYAMDEDVAGNFRMLTKTWDPQLATHLFVFDPQFHLVGNLLNIEPGEEFKSARYIGDKLYLVTFKQVDPLFVVDLATIQNPRIVGELKIPGYSTYLHPYDHLQKGVQYLVGLGYATHEDSRGRVRNVGIKLDLYRIDFSAKETVETKCSSLITPELDAQHLSGCLQSATKCSAAQLLYETCVSQVNSGNIAVSLVHSYVFTGNFVSSPALHHPRTFVWNSTKKELMLPFFSLQEE